MSGGGDSDPIGAIHGTVAPAFCKTMSEEIVIGMDFHLYDDILSPGSPRSRTIRNPSAVPSLCVFLGCILMK
ncbi:MAG: hypothetical protein PHS41_05945 [Victivallaceae bacterium]|nr:hypothetical protein [Victivallaceae bacterium]